jgi:anti-anti-sigma factor
MSTQWTRGAEVARLEITQELLAKEGVRLVRPVGKLDVFSFGDLKVFFEALRGQDKAAKVVVDMSRADYVASSGWSVLMGWRKLMRLGGGTLALCGQRPEVRRVYDSMKISKLLPTFEDVAAAAEALKKEAPADENMNEN